jgi:hypothetical protein
LWTENPECRQDSSRLLEIRFDAPGSVAGSVVEVVDGAPRPLPEATVELWSRAGTPNLVPLQRVTSAADGTFGFELVPTGNFEVRAVDELHRRIGYLSGRLASAQSITDLVVTVAGLGGASMEARVCGQGGPATGSVLLTVTQQRWNNPFLGRAGTDLGPINVASLEAVSEVVEFQDGIASITVAGLLSGTWTVRASSGSHGGAAASFAVPGDGSVISVPDLCLQPTGSIAGRVVMADTLSPVPNAAVSLWSRSCGGPDQCVVAAATT